MITIDLLENSYRFECEAGPLKNCVEWQKLKADIGAAVAALNLLKKEFAASGKSAGYIGTVYTNIAIAALAGDLGHIQPMLRESEEPAESCSDGLQMCNEAERAHQAWLAAERRIEELEAGIERLRSAARDVINAWREHANDYELARAMDCLDDALVSPSDRGTEA